MTQKQKYVIIKLSIKKYRGVLFRNKIGNKADHAKCIVCLFIFKNLERGIVMFNTVEAKGKFIAMLTDVAQRRKGVDKLLEWLETTDFYKAPASTRFHGSYEGGLLEHSLNVYDAFQRLFGQDGDDADSVIITTLLHDICKTGFYTVEMRNRKNDRGEWEKVPFYAIDDQFPYGHGEKSVYLIERFVRLKTEEAVAIRWHMGGFDDAVKGGSYALTGAFEKYPLALKLHMADMYASYMIEGNSK